MKVSGSLRIRRPQSPFVAREPAAVDSRQLTLALEGLLEQLKTQDSSPTFDTFWGRFVLEHARANRQKPRGVDSKESIYRIHLRPRFGALRLSALRDEDVQRLKADLTEHKPKTVNNILSVLSKLLKVAVKWKVIAVLPVTIDFLPVEQPEVQFYDFEEYRRVTDYAEASDLRTCVTVFLGGDAGLRLGEMIGLEWDDVDLKRSQIHVRRSVSQGEITLPKGGRSRIIDMTRKLSTVLNALAVSKATSRVLVRDSGAPVSEQTLRTWIGRIQAAASFARTGVLHILRHTFCSHLAMRGAPALAISKLAGHTSIRTTERYMHLSPFEAKRAIQLLDQRMAPHGNPSAPAQSTVSPTGFEPVLPAGVGRSAGLAQGKRRRKTPESRRADPPDALALWRAALDEAQHDGGEG